VTVSTHQETFSLRINYCSKQLLSSAGHC